MQSCARPLNLLGVVALAALFGLPARVPAQDAPIKNLRVPLDFYDNGQVKTQVTAGTANLGNGGSMIEAKDVRIEMFAPDGTVVSRAEAAGCTIDRDKGVATSSTSIRVERQGMTLRGVGFEWHANDQSFKILSQAQVVLARDPGFKLWKLP